MTPFDILHEDIDDFILMCNHLCGMGRTQAPPQEQNEKEESAAFWAAL